jgi:hypothetical protein
MSDSKRAAKPVIEFQNEWAQIEQALRDLDFFDPHDGSYGEVDCCAMHLSLVAEEALCVLLKHVPTIMKAYVDLFAMSQVLADEYERLVKKNQGLALPSGLVLPK